MHTHEHKPTGTLTDHEHQWAGPHAHPELDLGPALTTAEQAARRMPSNDLTSCHDRERMASWKQ